MENYFYKCPICGFIHLVPAYWVDFAPTDVIELVHMNMKTGKDCENTKLELLGNESMNPEA